MNTSSLKCIYSLLKKALNLATRNIRTSVDWCYEFDDIDMFEIGEDFSALLNYRFNFVKIEDI